MNNSIVQWGFDLVRNSYLNRDKEIEEKNELYLNYLAPFSMEFFSGNHPILLFGGHDFAEVTKKGNITIRDGLIPLSLFFQNTKPEEIDGILYVHCDFWFVVPEEWRPKIKYYRIKAKQVYNGDKTPKKILVTGLLNSTLADPVEFDSMLKHLKESIGSEKIGQAEILAFFPEKRTDLWGSWEEDNILRFSKSIFNNLGLNVATPAWKDLATETDFNDYLYYEINSGLFIKDSYVQHRILSRGGGLLEEKSSDFFRKSGEVKASLYHSYELFELNHESIKLASSPFPTEKIPYFKRIAEHEFNSVKLNFDWEKWYAYYIKKMIKDRHSIK